MNTRSSLPSPLTPPGGVTHYRDHILDELRHDPYQATQKCTEPTACPKCGLVFQRGRWQRGTAPSGAHATACPACRRSADKLPAGFITITGPFVSEHRADLLGLVRNEAEREGQEHPLHRVMAIDEGEDAIVITTTDLHLPRRIGRALVRAYDGQLEFQHTQDEYMLRVRWSR